MSISDLMVLRGRVGTGLVLRRPEDGGRSFVRFRMVVPRPRRKDNGEWEEGEAQWHTIRAWGALAEHLSVSLHKGQPVVVIGRPTASAWIASNGELRSELAVNAMTAGHDLTFGVALYSRLSALQGAAEGLGTLREPAGDDPKVDAEPDNEKTVEAGEEEPKAGAAPIAA